MFFEKIGWLKNIYIFEYIELEGFLIALYVGWFEQSLKLRMINNFCMQCVTGKKQN